MATRTKLAAGVAAVFMATAGYIASDRIPGHWRKMADEGEVFTLSSVPQTVRIGKGNQWVEKVMNAGGICSMGLFSAEDPAPGVTKQCDIKSGQAPDPELPGVPSIHNVGVQVAASGVWPGTAFGSNLELLTPQDAGSPHTGIMDGGDFRTVCETAKFDFIDPIVYPGQPAGIAHHHTFFGNTKIDHLTTTENIRTRNSPRSTCRGGSANFASYWVPSMLQMIAESGTRGIPVRANLLVYYKTIAWRYIGITGETNGVMNPPPPMTPLPLGLRMISGVATRTTYGNPISFTCHFQNEDYNMETNPQTGQPHDVQTIPTFCPQYAPHPVTGVPHLMTIWGHLDFGQCWNGELDSENHRDHLVDVEENINPVIGSTSGGQRAYRCPSTHPYILIKITFIPQWPMSPTTGASQFTLSSDVYTINSGTGLLHPSTSVKRGHSFHGDWMNGWDPAIVTRWHTHCMSEAERRNCGTWNTGDGWQAEPPGTEEFYFPP